MNVCININISHCQSTSRCVYVFFSSITIKQEIIWRLIFFFCIYSMTFNVWKGTWTDNITNRGKQTRTTYFAYSLLKNDDQKLKKRHFWWGNIHNLQCFSNLRFYYWYKFYHHMINLYDFYLMIWYSLCRTKLEYLYDGSTKLADFFINYKSMSIYTRTVEFR